MKIADRVWRALGDGRVWSTPELAQAARCRLVYACDLMTTWHRLGAVERAGIRRSQGPGRPANLWRRRRAWRGARPVSFDRPVS